MSWSYGDYQMHRLIHSILTKKLLFMHPCITSRTDWLIVLTTEWLYPGCGQAAEAVFYFGIKD